MGTASETLDQLWGVVGEYVECVPVQCRVRLDI